MVTCQAATVNLDAVDSQTLVVVEGSSVLTRSKDLEPHVWMKNHLEYEYFDQFVLLWCRPVEGIHTWNSTTLLLRRLRSSSTKTVMGY